MLNKQIGPYKIISKLGEGGMANVYLAEKGSLAKKVALKVLKDEFLLNQHIRNRFLSEAKKMSGLNHANIVSVHDLIDEKDFVAIELDFVEGKTLKQHLHEKGALPDEEIESLFKQMLDALAYIHEKGFVHRDVKPSNFMLTENGIIKLTDFGIAKNVDDSNVDYTGTGTGMQMGTPKYMSPEQVRSTKDVDHRTDIYSLGVVLWEMVTGKVPYDIETSSTFDVFTKIVNEPLKKTNTRWDEVIQKATKKELYDRYAHIRDVILNEEPREKQGNESPTPVEWLNSKRRKSAKIIYGVIGVGALLLMLIIVYVSRPKGKYVVGKKIEKIKSDTSSKPERRQKTSLNTMNKRVEIIDEPTKPIDESVEENDIHIKQIDHIEAIKKFDDAKDFSNSGLAAVKINGKWGYIDKKGNTVIPFKYSNADSFSKDLAAVEMNGKWGYVDKKGKNVIPFKYDFARPFSEGLASVGMNGNCGYIDKSGNTVISIECSRVFPGKFSEGLASVSKNNKWGYIDKKGNQVIPFRYDYALSFSEGLAAVEINDKWGYIDKKGDQVIPFKYDYANRFSEGLAYVLIRSKDNAYDLKMGFIDKNGSEIIPFKYDFANPFYEGLTAVGMNGKAGFIDKNGKEVIPFRYDYASSFSEGLAAVEINDKWGYIDKHRVEVIPNTYDEANDFSEGMAKVKIDRVYFFIDKKGYPVGLK